MSRARCTVALLTLLGACSHNDANRTIADALASPDGASVSDAPVTPTTPVTVTVRTDLASDAGWQTYFQNPDQTVAASPVTDATGTASAMVATGGSVTVVLHNSGLGGGPANSLYTWSGVKPGDHLVLDQKDAFTSATVTIKFPNDTADGASIYETSSNCEGAAYVQPPAGVAISASAVFISCPNDKADILVYTRNADGVIKGWFYVPTQSVVNGTTLDLTAHAYTAAPTRTFSLTNNTSTSLLSLGLLYSNANGRFYDSGRFDLATGTTATTSSTSVKQPGVPAGAFETLEITQILATDERLVLETGIAKPAYTQDWSTKLLPDFTSAAPLLDPGTHTVSWVLGAATTRTPDFTGVMFRALRGQTSWDWTWFGPAGTGTTATLPTLPVGELDYNVAAGDGVEFQTLAITQSPGGWDAARADVMQGALPTTAGQTITSNLYNFGFDFHARQKALWQPYVR